MTIDDRLYFDDCSSTSGVTLTGVELLAWGHDPLLGLLFAVDRPVASLAVDELRAERYLLEPLLVESVSDGTLQKHA